MTKPGVPVDLILSKLAKDTGGIQSRLQKASDVLLSPLETKIASTPYEVVYQEDRVKLKYYKAKKDIVETAISNGSFTTLVAALGAAGLVETLQGDGPFTVFAPTDEAFEKLPAGTVENLLLPENKDQLTAILTYHVVAGNVTSAQVVKLDSATTVNGQDVRIKVNEDVVMVDGATVAAVDVMASNGVIHVIDQVILPN